MTRGFWLKYLGIQISFLHFYIFINFLANKQNEYTRMLQIFKINMVANHGPVTLFRSSMLYFT